MTREIKFKFHIKFDKKPEVYVFTLEEIIKENTVLSHDLTEIKAIYQSTGLRDKNGKEIYEDDLVKLDDNIYRIRYETLAARFWFFTTKAKSQANYSASSNVPARKHLYWFDCEIIGNIYENPELLKT